MNAFRLLLVIVCINCCYGFKFNGYNVLKHWFQTDINRVHVILLLIMTKATLVIILFENQ